jgi:tyrosine-protein kinase Etk/Wzc
VKLDTMNSKDIRELDFKEIYVQLAAKKGRLIFLTILGIFLGFVYSAIAPNLYNASSVVQLEKRESNVGLPTSMVGDLANFGGKDSIATEVHVIKSRLILAPVADELDLFTFSKPKTIPVWGDYINRTKLLDRFPILNSYVPEGFVRHDESITISKFNLKPNLVGKTYTVKALGDNQYTISDGVNSFIGKVGVTLNLGQSGVINIDSLIAQKGRIFYLRKLSTRSIVSKISSGLIIDERGATGIVDFKYTGTNKDMVIPIVNSIIKNYMATTLRRKSAEIDQSIAFIAQQLPTIRKELETAINNLIEFRKKNNSVMELSFSTQDLIKNIINLETKLERMDFEMDQLSKRVTSNHPEYMDMELERQREKQRLTNYRADLGYVPEAEQELAFLTQNQARARTLEIQLIERIEQLRIYKASKVGNIRVLEPAEVFSHIGPNRNIFLLIGGIFGFLFTASIIFLKNYFNNGIEDVREIEHTGLPIFGTISALPDLISRGVKSIQYMIAFSEPDHPVVEAFRGLRTGLHFSLSSTERKVVVITSSAPNEGKSFVSTNLAIVSATEKNSVLIVDTDMRRGELRKSFSIGRNKNGLSDILSGNISYEEGVYESEIPNLFVIPTGKRPPNPAELLDTERFSEFMTWAGKNYDLVILDAPPVLAVADPLILGRFTDIIILVLRHLKTPVNEVESSLKVLETSGLKITGAILNGYDQKKSKYGTYAANYGYAYTAYNYQYPNKK